MPRVSRPRSRTGIYHIILRGNNHQSIFLQDPDYEKFLDLLSERKDTDHFRVLAYALMPNHIHLLFEEREVSVSESMKHINQRFVLWYNRKYERSGVLMDNRFKSEPVDSDSYLLTVFRYIIQNPYHAGLETHPGQYRWTSFAAYRARENGNTESIFITDTERMMAFFSPEKPVVRYLSEENRDYCMENYSPRMLNWHELQQLSCRLTGISQTRDFQQLGWAEREMHLRTLLSVGFSIKQLNLLTGISAGEIEKVSKKMRSSTSGKKHR